MVRSKRIELTHNVHLSPGTHIVYTYSCFKKYFEKVVSFIIEGLLKDQFIIYVDLSKNFNVVSKQLNNIGYSDNQIDEILFIDSNDLYGTDDLFDPDDISEKVNYIVSPFLTTDKIVRVWGSVIWKSEQYQPLIPRIAKHESNYDMFACDNSHFINVCSYHMSTLSAPLLIELLKTHEYHMTDTNLAESHLYNKESMLFTKISEQINAEKKAQDRVIRSEKLSTAGELAASIAHELRNPLAVVNAYLQMIDKMDNFDNTLKKYLKTINEQIEKIEWISGEFLALAKPIIEKITNINILIMFEDIKMIMNAQAATNGIDIIIDMKDNIMIDCDQDKIKQVLINLVKNSIEAMSCGKITLTATNMSNVVRIYVIDNGPGIPEDILNKLGQPFMTTKEGGTGLGLLICEKIIDGHNGTLIVDTEVGRGTTFTISLPKK